MDFKFTNIVDEEGIVRGTRFLNTKEDTCDINEYPDISQIEYTHQNVILCNMDYRLKAKCFIGGWDPTTEVNDDGSIGQWTDSVDKSAHIYYFCDGDSIVKFFAVEKQFIGMFRGDNILYVLEHNGVMYDVTPEVGDVIFSSYSEANKFKNKLNK